MNGDWPHDPGLNDDSVQQESRKTRRKQLAENSPVQNSSQEQKIISNINNQTY